MNDSILRNKDFYFATFVSIIITFYILLRNGISSPEVGPCCIMQMVKNGIECYNPDIFLQMAGSSKSLFTYLFSSIHDIPLVHLLLGLIIRFLTFLIYYVLVLKLFKKHSIATLSLALIILLQWVQLV